MDVWDSLGTIARSAGGRHTARHPDTIWLVDAPTGLPGPPPRLVDIAVPPAERPLTETWLEIPWRRLTTRRSIAVLLAAAALRTDVDDLVISRSCSFCGDQWHGPPTIQSSGRRLHLQTATDGDRFAVALAVDAFGLDLVTPGALSPDDVATARRAVDGWTVMEQLGLDPAATWAGLEAVGKALGLGLAMGSDDVSRALDTLTIRWFEVAGRVVAVAHPGQGPVPSFVALDSTSGSFSSAPSGLITERPAGGA